MTLIDRITAALERATPGPWFYEDGIEPGAEGRRDPDMRYLYNETGAMCVSVDAEGCGSSCSDADLTLAALAPEMAAFITGLRQEWAVLLINPAGERWLPLDEDWYDSLEDANGEKERWIRRGYPDSHLVSRWVSNPEVDA